MKQTLNYLALGDSYTIGEAIDLAGSFPFQLVNLLRDKNLSFDDPKIIAKTGWTTGELIEAVEKEGVSAVFDLVTLLVGVNNQYRGLSKDEYKVEFGHLLDTAIAFAGGKREHVYVLSIPDWGVTNFAVANGKNAKIVAEEIDAFNNINREEAMYKHVGYIDITAGSRELGKKAVMLAQDGLHPSAEMYAEWASSIANEIVLTGNFNV
jgi:lysophospholipase L1-like esterase